MESKTKSTPRDVFLYLLGMATLYFSAFWLIRLLFEFTNVAFPDALNPYYDAGSSMRWAIASLTIVFPVYVWVTWFLGRDMKRNPEKADIKIRKWLVYLTLFLAALLIIGDLVALIYYFLGGDLTFRFVLKVGAVLAVGAMVFGYYFYDLRKKANAFSQSAKIFVWIACGAVAVAVVAGFFVAGSPFRQRLIRFDNERVSDLQIIQSQIVNYWQTKKNLPANLNDLKDSISGFVPPQDPEKTHPPYIYNVKGPLTFELCATFNLPSFGKDRFGAPTPAYPATVYEGGFAGENWNHGVGEQCFPRTIDPERYGIPKPLHQ